MNRYEALLALNTRGKEETIKDTIERLENTLKAEGTTSNSPPKKLRHQPQPNPPIPRSHGQRQ